MKYTNQKIQGLLEMPVDQINQLEGGEFSDNLVFTALLKLEESDQATFDPERKLALEKLIWRSPEVDPSKSYNDLINDILEDVIQVEHGDNFLYWALASVVYHTLLGEGWMGIDQHWNYARGFLYKNQAKFFIRFLDYLLDKTTIPDYLLRSLIQDLAVLGQPELAKQLDEVGQKRYLAKWHPIDFEELVEDTQTPHLELRDSEKIAVLGKITPNTLADVDEDSDITTLISSKKAFSLIQDDVITDDILLFIPDAIHIVVRKWYSDRETSIKILKFISILEKILPELSLLGDLLEADQKDVFLLNHLGKTQGYCFETLNEMLVNKNLNPNLRADAACALMEIVSEAPNYRQQIVNILEKIIIQQEAENVDEEEFISAVIANLPDTDFLELKGAVAKAFENDVVSPVFVTSKDFSGKWNIPELKSYPTHHSGKYILLECNRCQRTRLHNYQTLFLDFDSFAAHSDMSSQTIFTKQDIICPKCGAVNDYQVSLLSMFKLIPPQFLTDDSDNFLDHLNQYVYLIFPEYLYIGDYSPYLFTNLRHQVITNGLDSLDFLSKGEYLRVVGKFKDSLKALRRAYEEKPKNQSATLALAMAEHDYGERERAEILYKQIINVKGKDPLIHLDNPRTKIALQAYKALLEHEQSPYPYPKNKFKNTLLKKK